MSAKRETSSTFTPISTGTTSSRPSAGRTHFSSYPEEWHDEWAGANELWDLDMSGPEVVTYPRFNRLLIFSTSEGSNHGQPVPNACPPGVYRKVLNLYYYTSARDDEPGVEPHFTLYKSADQPSDRDPKAAGWNTEASPFAMSLGEDYRRTAELDATTD